MSFMSVDGTRSATKHAGVPAVETATFSYTAGVTGATTIVSSPGDGRKIKLLSYTISLGDHGTAELASSSTTIVAGTSLTGLITADTHAAAPFTQTGSPITGIGTCVVGHNLVVSGATAEGAGNVTYSLVP